MSAYLCDSDHLSAIVNAAVRSRLGKAWIMRHLKPETAFTVDGLNSIEEALFSDLLETNLESLGARYPGEDKISDWVVDGGDSFRYSSDALYQSPIEAIKGVQCYEYQSCEHEGWKASPVRELMENLVHDLISRIDGYEEAAWGFQPLAVGGR